MPLRLKWFKFQQKKHTHTPGSHILQSGSLATEKFKSNVKCLLYINMYAMEILLRNCSPTNTYHSLCNMKPISIFHEITIQITKKQQIKYELFIKFNHCLLRWNKESVCFKIYKLPRKWRGWIRGTNDTTLWANGITGVPKPIDLCVIHTCIHIKCTNNGIAWNYTQCVCL